MIYQSTQPDPIYSTSDSIAASIPHLPDPVFKPETIHSIINVPYL